MDINIIDLIALYTDYETTLDIVTLTKKTVSTLARSENYFWKRKVKQEVRYILNSDSISKWSTAYLILNKQFFGDVYYQDEHINNRWKIIVRNAIKMWDNIIITDKGVYSCDYSNKWELILTGPEYINIVDAVRYESYIYLVRSDGVLFTCNVNWFPNKPLRYTLPYIIDIKLYKYSPHIISATTRSLDIFHIIVSNDTGKILGTRNTETTRTGKAIAELPDKYYIDDTARLYNNDGVLIYPKTIAFISPYYLTTDRKLHTNTKTKGQKYPRAKIYYTLLGRKYEGPISCIGWYVLAK